jgi:hypothetical protein
MRFARNFLLLTLALGAVACSDDNLGPTSAVIPPLAFVRYINALPDTFATTVRWIDDIEFTPQTFTNVGFRTEGQGGFQGLRAGSRSFRVFTYQQNTLEFPIAGNTTVLADTTFNFVAGTYYTILHTGFTRTGSTPAAQLRIIEDNPPAPPASGVLLRVFNVAYGLDYDLYLGNALARADTTFGVPDTTITVDTTYAVAPGNAGVDTTITTDTTIVTPRTITSREVNGNLFTAGELGTLVGSGAAVNVGTASQAYTARSTGSFAARLTNAGALTTLGVRLIPPTGLAETADFEAAGGMTVAGSVLTAWVFNRKPAGTPGAATANSTPTILWTVDNKPARTVAP